MNYNVSEQTSYTHSPGSLLFILNTCKIYMAFIVSY